MRKNEKIFIFLLTCSARLYIKHLSTTKQQTMCPSTIKAKIQQLEEVLALWNAKLDEFTASNEKYGIESARYHINEIEKKIKRQNKRLAEAEEAARRIDVMWGRA